MLIHINYDYYDVTLVLLLYNTWSIKKTEMTRQWYKMRWKTEWIIKQKISIQKKILCKGDMYVALRHNI
jgi:hypothetical protein